MSSNTNDTNINNPSTETDKIVAAYLSKRGFKNLEAQLRSEANLKPSDISKGSIESISEFLLFQNEKESSYEKCFSSLRSWTLDSIDFYKSELEPVLYPIFVHCYLDLITKGLLEQAQVFLENFKSDYMDMNAQDISRLSGITEANQVHENELAQSYRENKYGIIMSRYPFELLLGYLQDQGFMSLLRIVNQYLNIQVTNDKPSDKSSIERAGGLIGKNESITSLVAQYPVTLGKLPLDLAFSQEMERYLIEKNLPDGQVLLSDFKKLNQPDPEAPNPVVAVPLPPRKVMDITKEIQELREIRQRVELSSTTLPSICCYTFHNTQDGLNSLDISNDGTLISGGFEDSYLRIWNLNQETRLPPKNSQNETRTDAKILDSSIRLIGHSGPVYSSAFGHDNRYLISCSEDKTARLWSLDTFKNVVVYKGHNYPIWDVDVSPYGLYFATASHDKTARLWSTDHVYSLRLFVGHLSDVETVRFHPNCNYIITGSSDRTCRMWDIQRGTTVRMFTKHSGPVNQVSISPDGKQLVTASDSGLCLWDLGSGKKIKSMTMNNKAQVHSLAFSRDGNILSAGCGDEAVRIWDVKSDATQELQVFYTKKTPVYKVFFSKRNLLYSLVHAQGSHQVHAQVRTEGGAQVQVNVTVPPQGRGDPPPYVQPEGSDFFIDIPQTGHPEGNTQVEQVNAELYDGTSRQRIRRERREACKFATVHAGFAAWYYCAGLLAGNYWW